ncbi:hypothetical protein F5146DRAFT_1006040 [Armillaria mellea]|nr:hypothetical protein F5146DRAFT_1006040 [Armillaria mellea]
MDEREFPIPPWFLFHDLFSHGSPPKISHYRRKATGSPSEESMLLRNISSILHRREISTRRKLSYQSQSSHHARGKQEALQPAQEAKSPAKIRNATPHPQVPVIDENAKISLKERYLPDYVKSLLSQLFQGQFSAARMQTAYKDISTKALDVDGPSNRHKKMECAGETIGQLISWLEDIWHAGIDGPYGLRIAYNNLQAKVAKRG